MATVSDSDTASDADDGDLDVGPWCTLDSSNDAGPDWRRKLLEFYLLHNAAKAPSVDSILQDWRGQEHALFACLRRKYRALHTSM